MSVLSWLAGVMTSVTLWGDSGKLEALRWVVFDLDAKNKVIASRVLGIQLADLDALRRVFQVI